MSHKKAFLLIVIILIGIIAQVTTAQQPPADPTMGVTLEGYAVLPSDTFAEGPAAGSLVNPETTFGRTVPFESQPVQGFSAVLPAGNGNYWVMPDNGFGAKDNSEDFHLRWYEVSVDFEVGTVSVVGFTQLSDPNRVVPFPIFNEDTEERILTGYDFDPESFRQAPDGTFWFGDEFGPFLLHVAADGTLLEAPIPTPYPEVLAPFARDLPYVQSPQHPDFVGLADQAAQTAAANHRRSRGLEGMAINTSGTMLYPILEGSLQDDPLANRLLIQEFDLATNAYTGRYFFYPMSNFAHSIGDMTAISDTQFLIIERDGGQGATAAFKRVYLIDLTQASPDGYLPKQLLVDLLAIGDVNGLTTAEEGALGYGEVFGFPFETIESIYTVDADTLLIVNDNNFPFSSGRRPGVSDDNEFILLTLPEPLDLAE